MSCCDVCGFIRTLFSKSGATRQMLLPLIKKDASAKQSQQYQVAHSITACRPWNNNLESVEFSSTGGPLLTRFFETLEKQPCKQKTV